MAEMGRPGVAAMDSERKSVLVVDDSPEYLQMLRTAIGPDYEIIEASDGDSAVKAALGSGPDAILMDLLMPNATGLEAVRRLQEDERTRDIPVILLTAKRVDGGLKRLIETERNIKACLDKAEGLAGIYFSLKGLLSGAVTRGGEPFRCAA